MQVQTYANLGVCMRLKSFTAANVPGWPALGVKVNQKCGRACACELDGSKPKEPRSVVVCETTLVWLCCSTLGCCVDQV
jgi:hypothetical protein